MEILYMSAADVTDQGPGRKGVLVKKLLGLFIVFALFFVSCATLQRVDFGYPQRGNMVNTAPLPVKDYETLGIIFVESAK